MATYPPYVPPSTAGVTFSAGGQGTQQQLPAGDLCWWADANKVYEGMGGEFFNGATDSQLNYVFEGLDPKSELQPWYLRHPDGDGFIGQNVKNMYREGVGKPGKWTRDEHAQWHFIYDAEPVEPTTPPPSGIDPGDASIADVIMGRSADTAVMQKQVEETYRLVQALAKKAGIK